MSIYLCYRIGSVNMAYSGANLAAPVSWMGLRGEQVKEFLDEAALQDLSPVDVAKVGISFLILQKWPSPRSN